MIEFKQGSRPLLALILVLGLVGIVVGQMLGSGKAEAQRAESRPYILGPAEGEHLVTLRGDDLVIKIDPSKGSQGVSVGTQRVPLGVGIRSHRHAHMDEFFYVLEGSGTAILNNERYALEKGVTMFIPKGVSHGFENPTSELLVLWGVTPPGLEEFFREIASPRGTPPKSLTPEQVGGIRQRLEAEQARRLQAHRDGK